MFIATYDRTGTFGRLPALGLVVQPLVNPSLRKYAFSAAEGGGGGGGGGGGDGDSAKAVGSSSRSDGVAGAAVAAQGVLAVPSQAAAHRNGVLVVEVEPLSCAAGKVHEGDILMALDGVSVSEQGDVEFRGYDYILINITPVKAHTGGSAHTVHLTECVLEDADGVHRHATVRRS